MSLDSDSTLDESSDRSISSRNQPASSGMSGQHYTLQPDTSANTPQFSSIISQSMCPTGCPPAIILCSHKKSSGHKEYVSESFISDFNSRYGDHDKIQHAKRLMKKMRILGGLHPSSTPDSVDIPSARMGFALLAGLNNHDLKMEALSHLEYLLENDPITEVSSILLIDLTIQIMNQLDRVLIQKEILEVQVKRAKIYGLLAELIQRHFQKKHINAITDDLKVKLLKASRDLRELNRLEDNRLDFYVESALEGIKRILDDHKALYEIAGRLYNGAMLGISFYFRDLNHAPAYTEGALAGIDPKIKFSWYDTSMTILRLGRDAVHDPVKLAALQKFVFDKAKDVNWRFLYLAVDLLTNIAINSPDPKIRKAAFSGNRLYEEFPGILAFSGCELLGKEWKIKQVARLELPKRVNHDSTIRLTVAKSLIRISEECPDLFIRKRARTEFLNRLKSEESERVREFMTEKYKAVQGRELSWINEEPPFDIYPIKKKELDTTSLTPRRHVNFSALIQQALVPSQATFTAPQSPICSSSAPPRLATQRKESRVEDLVSASDLCLERGLLSEANSIITSAIKKARAKKVDPHYLSTLYSKRGSIYYELNDIDGAQHDLIKALEYDADNSDATDLLSKVRNLPSSSKTTTQN